MSIVNEDRKRARTPATGNGATITIHTKCDDCLDDARPGRSYN